MPRLPGSPAIDAGSNAATTGITTDQRGFARVVDGDGNMTAIVDIGAAEFIPALDLTAFWTFDFDGDGNGFGIEHAVGTAPLVSDAGAIGNLKAPVFNLSGDAEIRGWPSGSKPHGFIRSHNPSVPTGKLKRRTS